MMVYETAVNTVLTMVFGFLLYSAIASVLSDEEPPEPMLYTYKGELNRRYHDDTNWFELDE
jgi:hypothetical protein